MSLVLKFWRECLILTLAALLGIGYLMWPGEPEVVTKEVVKERVVTKTLIRTVTKLPDGTVIEKVEDISQVSKSKSDKVASAAVGQAPRYSVILLSPVRAPTRPEVVLGAQLGRLPAEAFAAYDFESKAVKLGVGIRF